MNKDVEVMQLGAICAIVGGIAFVVPMVFIFILMPAAGLNWGSMPAEQFLPQMAQNGGLRSLFWWTVALPFFIIFLSVPGTLKKTLETHAPGVALLAERIGAAGLFLCAFSSAVLAAGEMPLAQAYAASLLRESQIAIAAVYDWQTKVTALLFDVCGFLMIGLWILLNSAIGLKKKGSLPTGFSAMGMLAALLCFCFAIGYLAQLRWLGEFGIGGLAYFVVPAWVIWLGIFLWRKYKPAA